MLELRDVVRACTLGDSVIRAVDGMSLQVPKGELLAADEAALKDATDLVEQSGQLGEIALHRSH